MVFVGEISFIKDSKHPQSYTSSKPNENATKIFIANFSVPQIATINEDVNLYCSYKVEGMSLLYSLKWYKGGSQFYAYIPSYEKSHAAFSVNGLTYNQIVGIFYNFYAKFRIHILICFSLATS